MRNVVVGLRAIAFALLISGCGELTARMDPGQQPQQANVTERDENMCRSRGATPEYYGFLECKKQLANERASAEAAAKANPPEGDNNTNAVPAQ